MKKTRGFTIIELLIAVSIFTVIVVATSYFYITSFRTDKDSALKAQIVSDAEFVLQKIEKAVREGTIDYEEYNNQLVKDGEYGANYGEYKKKFYNNKINTGQNPSGAANETEQTYANALCEGSPACKDKTSRDELYLINAQGDKKTIFVPEAVGNNAFAVSYITMKGFDSDKDGIIDDFECSEEFVCQDINGNVIKKPLKADKDLNDPNDADLNKNFVPISPQRVNIKSLNFYIHPIENPFSAVMEKGMHYTPYIEVMMEIEASGSGISFTLQKTITTKLLTEPKIPIKL